MFAVSIYMKTVGGLRVFSESQSLLDTLFTPTSERSYKVLFWGPQSLLLQSTPKTLL